MHNASFGDKRENRLSLLLKNEVLKEMEREG